MSIAREKLTRVYNNYHNAQEIRSGDFVMATEIDYGNLPANEKRQRALDDLRNWSSYVNWDNVFKDISEFAPTPANAKRIAFQFNMFLGVSGYPVTAMLAECWNLTDDEVADMLTAEDSE